MSIDWTQKQNQILTQRIKRHLKHTSSHNTVAKAEYIAKKGLHQGQTLLTLYYESGPNIQYTFYSATLGQTFINNSIVQLWAKHSVQIL